MWIKKVLCSLNVQTVLCNLSVQVLWNNAIDDYILQKEGSKKDFGMMLASKYQPVAKRANVIPQYISMGICLILTGTGAIRIHRCSCTPIPIV